MANRSRMRTRRGVRRAALVAAATAVPFVALASGAAAADSSVAVQDAAEAWYASAPIDICTTPLGCPPQQVPTSPYPAGSLHVGVAGGRETARTYVQPDLARVPFGATLLAGTMTLHVDTANSHGTVSPGSARILACLVTAAFTDGTEGAATTPPAVDCTTSAKPAYDDAAGVFTLDLAPFLSAWNAAKPELGIALVPNQTEVAQTDAWHVTIEGRKQTGAKPVTSTISYRAPADTGSSMGLTPATPSFTQPAPPPVQGQVPAATSALPAPAPVVAPQQPAPVLAQRPAAFAGPVEQPAAFLAPLALVAGIVFFARLFTRDATPRRPA